MMQQSVTDKARRRQAEGGGKDLTSSLSTREFLYQLMNKSAEVQESYDSILVTGLGTRADLRIHLRDGEQILKSTKPAKLESYETPSEEGGAIKHLLFQLLHRRDSRVIEKIIPPYNQLLIDLNDDKSYILEFRLDDITKMKHPIPKDLGYGDTFRRIPSDPDYSSDPWE